MAGFGQDSLTNSAMVKPPPANRAFETNLESGGGNARRRRDIYIPLVQENICLFMTSKSKTSKTEENA